MAPYLIVDIHVFSPRFECKLQNSVVLIDDPDSGRAQAADLVDELAYKMRTRVLDVSPAAPAVTTEVSQLLIDLFELDGGTECRLDHDGGCQEHGWLEITGDRACPVARLRTLIASLDAEIAGKPHRIFPAGSPEPGLGVRVVRGAETFVRVLGTRTWVIKGMEGNVHFTWAEINVADLVDVTRDRS